MDKKKEKASCLRMRLAAESEAAEVNVAPLRLQWSQLGKHDLIADINIYVFLNLFNLLLWLYNIP